MKLLSIIYSIIVGAQNLFNKCKKYWPEILIIGYALVTTYLRIVKHVYLCTQINYEMHKINQILHYDQFWSLVAVVITFITIYKSKHPSLKIVTSIDSDLDAISYYILNDSSFGYTIGLEGVYIPVVPMLMKVRLRYSWIFKKLLKKNGTLLYNTKAPNNDREFNQIDIALNKDNNPASRAENEAPSLNSILDKEIKYKFINLKPNSITTPRAFYTLSVKDLMRKVYDNHKLIWYRFIHNRSVVLYLIFMNPKGKRIVHRVVCNTRRDRFNGK